MIDIRVLTTTDREWDDIVDTASMADFAHRRAYHAIEEKRTGAVAHLIVVRDGHQAFAWPYLRRRIEGSQYQDATSAYGDVGPIVVGEPDSAFLAAAWDALREAWVDQGLVTMFCRFHPVLGNATLAAGFSGEPCGPEPAVLVLGRSVSMDLTVPSDQRIANYDKGTRYEVRKAQRDGLVIHEDNHFVHLDDLVELYLATMTRNGADDRYFFNAGYFADLVVALGNRAHLSVAAYRDEVVGVLLYTVDGTIGQAHLTGLRNTCLPMSPLKALLDATADQARAHGASLLHLGAGRGGVEDSLFDFKRRLAPIEHRFAIGRWVLDADAYRDLLGGQPPASGFFPPYRASGARRHGLALTDSDLEGNVQLTKANAAPVPSGSRNEDDQGSIPVSKRPKRETTSTGL